MSKPPLMISLQYGRCIQCGINPWFYVHFCWTLLKFKVNKLPTAWEPKHISTPPPSNILKYMEVSYLLFIISILKNYRYIVHVQYKQYRGGKGGVVEECLIWFGKLYSTQIFLAPILFWEVDRHWMKVHFSKKNTFTPNFF